MDKDGNVNYIGLLKAIGNVCMTEHTCGKCQETGCFVGYARQCAGDCMKRGTAYVPNGMENIPHVDVKGGYDEEDTLQGIAHTLKECRSCKENHQEDCLIHVIRSCFEIIAFGDSRSYEGSVFLYLSALQEKYKRQAEKIAAFYDELMKGKES